MIGSCLVDHEEVHLAGIGVDHDLDRVAGVVEGRVEAAPCRHPGRVGVLGVGVVVGGRVGVDDPVHIVVEDHGVGVGVVFEERRGLVDHGVDVAVVHHPRRRGDLAGEDEVGVPEAQGEGGPADDAACLHPAGPLVAVGHGLARGRALVVDLRRLGVGDHVAARWRCRSRNRSRSPDLRSPSGGVPGRGQVAEAEVGGAVGVDAVLADRGQHGAVAVGVLEVLGHEPRGRQCGVELTDRGDGRRLLGAVRWNPGWGAGSGPGPGR